MAMRIRPALCRPIEITTGVNDRFTVTVAATPYTVIITPGVYACAMTLASEIGPQMIADSALTSAAMFFAESGDNPRMGVSGNTTFTLTAGAALLKLMGFTKGTDYSGEISYLSEDIPTSIWIPTYQNTNQDRFYAKQNNNLFGVMAKDGSLVGRTTGPVVYYRDLSFVHESAQQIFNNGCAESSDEADRCLESWAREAMISYPAAAGNPATRGFYFFEDVNDVIDAGSWTDNSMADNGINSDNTYVFCQLNKGGFSLPRPTAPTGRDLYGVQFQINTASTGSWTHI